MQEAKWQRREAKRANEPIRKRVQRPARKHQRRRSGQMSLAASYGVARF